MRLVLDTNVVVSGLLWNGAPRTILEMCCEALHSAFTSVALLQELMETPARAKFSGKIGASGFSSAELVDRYARTVCVVRPAAVPRLAPDVDDDVVIGTAVAARADPIVTGDLGLLSVGSFTSGRFVKVTEALDVIAPDGAGLGRR